ncbi:hypothetical protein N799_08310 [Lysobacter arseniciresistens ZS79]|uniref:Secreted protein n=1 Tax=Lysobacter arseniciresistens ZS79 TaxID=913325 RepID=A0A0A0F3P7_9GAMM|nr:hypothetical protein [Lysobacter arseniciresistens]KGM57429.1 hypothetical protein N799_08310 [Lysobacter arseniciresistens ZS79]
MDSRLLRLPLALLLALGVATGAHAQGGKAPAHSDSTVLPVWNNASGKLEAVLLLEPTGNATTGARWRFGRTTLDAAFGLDAGDTLGLVCDRKTGLATAIGNLANHCLLAALEQDGKPGSSRQSSIGAGISRAGTRLALAVGKGRDTLPAWLSPNGQTGRLDQNTLTVYGERNIGNEATVSIGGTWARARLIPAGDVPALADRWSSQSITVGADIGSFGANIVGRVVDTPSEPGHWEGLGVGLTWRTPWSGQLTVGAENLVTRGRNPFSPNSADQDEGTVPYVRYEQDL